ALRDRRDQQQQRHERHNRRLDIELLAVHYGGVPVHASLLASRLLPQPNGSALSCEPPRLRGSIEAPSFDARRRHWPIRARCGSAAAAPSLATPGALILTSIPSVLRSGE